MVVHKLSTKARLIPSLNLFSAPFTGVYDFGIAANVKQTVFQMDANVVYFLNSFSIGGNIASEDFLSAIATVPTLTLSRKNDGQQVYTRSFPIGQFTAEKDCTCFVESNKGGDELQATFAGVLNQTPNLLGVNPIIITLSFTCFALDDREYNTLFRDRLPGGF